MDAPNAHQPGCLQDPLKMRTATPVFAPVLKLTLLGASCLAISFAQASNELQLSRDLAAANQEAAKADDDPIFAIRGFRHQGNTLLDTLEIETILQRYTGKEGNFSKIQAAVSALEKRYLLAGYGAVKVLLPAQEIDDGIVDIRIVEGKIGKITVTGAQHFTPELLVGICDSVKPPFFSAALVAGIGPSPITSLGTPATA